MPNYSYRCPGCDHIDDRICSYEESIKLDAMICEKCNKQMIKYFGRAPLMVVPIGTTGNADNGYTSVSNVQKDRNAV